SIKPFPPTAKAPTQHQLSRVKHSTLGKETIYVVDIRQQPSHDRLGDHFFGIRCSLRPQGTHERPSSMHSVCVSPGDESTPSRVGLCTEYSHGPIWRDSTLSTLSLAFPASPCSGLRMRPFSSPDQLLHRMLYLTSLTRSRPWAIIRLGERHCLAWSMTVWARVRRIRHRQHQLFTRMAPKN
ncbi:hypothetical protein CTAM01_13119, partial [Colletotrichum tamarilloi]